jgi:hypothetical protein
VDGVDVPRDPEVDDLRAAVGHQHVGRGQIAVDDAGVVQRGQRVRQAESERHEHVLVGDRPVLADVAPQRRARDVLGDDVRVRAVDPDVQDAPGARAFDPPQRPGLAPEPRQRITVGQQILAQELERTDTEAGVVRAPHLTHSTGADPLDELPAVDGHVRTPTYSLLSTVGRAGPRVSVATAWRPAGPSLRGRRREG